MVLFSTCDRGLTKPDLTVFVIVVLCMIEEHYHNASFIKVTTKLNSDGSLKENGTQIQFKEKAFLPDE